MSLCHFPNCSKEIPDPMWACKPHWKKLRWDLKVKIQNAYTPGKGESRAYRDTVKEVLEWVKDNA